jgi:hypothetical protein
MAAIKLDIAKVFARLPQFLMQSEFVSTEFERTPLPRGIIHIDGKSCASAISLWGNGNCEVAFLSFNTEQKNIERYEFDSEYAAVQAITHALRMALEYA